MQGYEDAREKQLVLFLQWKREAIDDGAKDLEQLRNAVESLGLVDELKEDVVDGSSDEGAEIEEFAVDSVECGFQKVSFSGIFRIEKFEKLD